MGKSCVHAYKFLNRNIHMFVTKIKKSECESESAKFLNKPDFYCLLSIIDTICHIIDII